MNTQEILVSICCITYNHEKFIKEAIESFLSQETNFRIEIIIYDDASTDRTCEIIKEYAAVHQSKFVTILQTENLKSRFGGSMFAQYVFPKAKGKYIAICEGDDYWLDKMKLQKQVDFLENNIDFGLVHGDCHFYYQRDKRWELYANSNLSNSQIIIDKKEMFFSLINADYKIRTATVLFRRNLLTNVTPNTMQFAMGDTPLWLDFSQITKFMYFDDVFAVYRILENSSSRSTNISKQSRFLLSMYEMRIYYHKKFDYKINNILKNRYNYKLLDYLIFDYGYQPHFPLLNPSLFQNISFWILRISTIRKLILNWVQFVNSFWRVTALIKNKILYPARVLSK